ncbi:hypothetical protein GV51_0824 [Gardnerella vaginalis 5-1]|nr:hypothetical protein GV51_0824 [Gardnerella vaginalis 5-1]
MDNLYYELFFSLCYFASSTYLIVVLRTNHLIVQHAIS